MSLNCCNALKIEEDNPAEELERICPTSECGDGELPADGSFKLHISSSFKLSFQITEAEGLDIRVTNPRTVNFIFRYYILDQEELYLVASHIDGNATNCFLEEDRIIVVFENPSLPIGKLMVEYTFLKEDSYFIGRTKLTLGEYTGIKLIDDVTKVSRDNNFSMKVYQQTLPYGLLISLI